MKNKRSNFISKVLLVCLVFIPFTGFSQIKSFQFPQIAREGNDITDFIPESWEIKDSVQADFNEDKSSDLAMVVESKQSLNTNSNSFYPKMLIILFAKPDKSWQLSAIATQLFDTTGEDPFVPHPYQGLVVRRNTLGVQFAYGGTVVDNRTYYFRFQNKGWYLIGMDNEQIDKHKTFGVYLMKAKSVNFITGKETVKRYYPKDKKYTSSIINQSPKPLVELTEFGDNGLPYQKVMTNATGYINPTGTYKWKYMGPHSSGYPGHIQVKLLDKHRILLHLNVSRGAPSYNSGSAFDTLTYRHSQAVYRTRFDASCKITFRFTNKGVHVNEKADDYNHGCGFGHGVYTGGYFEKISSKVPTFINYSTGRKINLQP